MSIDEKLIKKLLSLDESGWLDFKQEMYRVSDKKAKDYDWQKNEVVRDILSLVNGNTHSVGKPAYLVIGAGDRRNPGGSRSLFDVGNMALPKKQVMDWVNAYAEPAVEEINTHLVPYQGKRLFIIEILPSRHVHKIKRPLQTGHHTLYHENTVFMRAGESIITAGSEQVNTLQQAKKQAHAFNRYVNPIWLLGLVLALLFSSINWLALGGETAQNVVVALGETQALLFMRVIAGLVFGLLGVGVGWSVMQMQDFRLLWIRATWKGRLALLLSLITVFAFVIWWQALFR